ncbi:hypothetical protein RJ640_004108 [Escallonia rubra]|uniref:Reverse transcriptase Ty1/copia-type domain-containing protein n=1 Tax=Escallonia rubra TaxID=112253 RepID=A0AA88RT37_9ASTE|nr:hypothetical protein RJ640_004108 [Escallonia rubra]
MASSSSTVIPQLHHYNTIKLTNSNYLLWQTQLLPILRSNNLYGLVDGIESCPPAEITVTGTTTRTPNPDYKHWVDHDQFVLSWINTSLSKAVLPIIVGHNTSASAWRAISDAFGASSHTHILQLLMQLHNTKRDDKPVATYLQELNSLTLIATLLSELRCTFDIRHLGNLNYFLGIEIVYTSSGLILSQRRYILDILQKAAMTDAKPLATPLSTSLQLSKTTGTPLPDPSLYRQVIGSLQYLTITRPELSFSINKLAQFMQTPTDHHWTALKRILRYLKGTLSHGLRFHKSPSISVTAFSDADWAGNTDDRRSTGGYAIFLGPNLVSWSAKKQPTVARSLTESEYRAVANATTELLWLKSLLRELGISLSRPPTLWCDNLGATYLSANPIFHARTKHIEVDFHYVRDQVSQRLLHIRFISTHDQIADIFTKALSTTRFIKLRDKLQVSKNPLNHNLMLFDGIVHVLAGTVDGKCHVWRALNSLVIARAIRHTSRLEPNKWVMGKGEVSMRKVNVPLGLKDLVMLRRTKGCCRVDRGGDLECLVSFGRRGEGWAGGRRLSESRDRNSQGWCRKGGECVGKEMGVDKDGVRWELDFDGGTGRR